MDTQFQLALDRLHASIQPRDEEAVAGVLQGLEITTLEAGRWPLGFFHELLALLEDQSFLTLRNSWHLLYFINNNWEQLLDSDVEQLIRALVIAYDKFGDSTGAFVTSEILGEHCEERAALAILTDLGKSASLPARALVPHGLETLAKAAKQESTRGLVITHLQELQKSESEEVRQEALISLRKLLLGPCPSVADPTEN